MCVPPKEESPMKKKLAITLLEEKLELHGNMVALDKFLDDPNNTRDIDLKELELMYTQLEGMKTYYGALNYRAYFHANQKWPDA
jgi:hypothetical protein